jgi:hypothetical protein
MRAQTRLWRAADGKRLVGDGDPAAAFLAYAAGDEVAGADQKLVNAPVEPEPESEEDPDDDGQGEEDSEEETEPEKVEAPAPAKKPTRRTRGKGKPADGSRW